MIPKFDEFMKPVLNILEKEQRSLTRAEIREEIGMLFEFTDEEKAERIPAGEGKISNRIGWAITYLYNSNLINRVKRGEYEINKEGILFNQANDKFLATDLPKTERFIKFNSPREKTETIEEKISDTTPEEALQENFDSITNKLESDLLEELLNIDPYRFEEIIVDVVVAMGYGGSREEASKVTRKTGDGGIDGVINDDRLGLEVIYLQAKRYKGSVGSPDVQKFVGALAGQHASKGIIITTGNFTKEAEEYAKNVGQRVILIDGEKLVSLMIEFDVGVYTKKTYVVKEISSDYFKEG